MNWSLAQEHLIDELSLVIAPVADGSTTAVPIFERTEFLPAGQPVVFRFQSATPMDGGTLWLRYQREEAKMS